MVGREDGPARSRGRRPRGELLLSVRGLGREGVFAGVSFDLHRGEVLGFAGLIGAGRTDVGLALFGIEPATSGTIVLDGKHAHHPARREAMVRIGIAYPPRTAASSACRCRCRSRQHLAAGPVALSQPLRPDPHGDGARAPRRLSASGWRSARRRSISGRQALRRQPAEGDAEQVAEHASAAAHPRRADARHRRRRQGRGARHDRRAGRPRASASS